MRASAMIIAGLLAAEASAAIYATAGQPVESPLAIARRLSRERFDGWKYGSDAAAKRIDCVQFVLAVVEEIVGRKLPGDAGSAVLITELEGSRESIDQAVARNDRRLAGVVGALVDHLGVGRAVEPREARPGDFIQYWRRRDDGAWFGHAALIEWIGEADDGAPVAKLFGSHAGLGRIGTSEYDLRLTGADRLVFIARIDP